MNRRSVLAAGLSLFPIGGGCVSRITIAGSCPDPAIENELSYEEYDSGPLKDLWDGAVLVTGIDEIDRFDEWLLNDVDRQWIAETDFTRNVVLGVQVGSSGESSDLEILGVERDGGTVHVYSCIAKPGRTDDWLAYTRLLRVTYEGDPPDSAVLTHWEGGEKTTYE